MSCFFNRPEELAVSTRARSAHKSSGGWQEFTTFQSRKKIKHNHNTPHPFLHETGGGVRLKSPDFAKCLGFPYFLLSATATATATVAPTMGLLPIENPEISLFYFGSKVQILHHFSIFIKQSSVLIVSHFI